MQAGAATHYTPDSGRHTGPVRFGEGTNDEMCYMFTLYYPKLSLTNGNPVATLIHGPNT